MQISISYRLRFLPDLLTENLIRSNVHNRNSAPQFLTVFPVPSKKDELIAQLNMCRNLRCDASGVSKRSHLIVPQHDYNGTSSMTLLNDPDEKVEVQTVPQNES